MTGNQVLALGTKVKNDRRQTKAAMLSTSPDSTQRTMEGVGDMMEVVGETVIAALTLFISWPLSMQLIGKDDDLNSNLRHCNIRFSHSFEECDRYRPTASTFHSSIFSPVCSIFSPVGAECGETC